MNVSKNLQPSAFEVEETYPMSPLQQGMLYHSLRAPGSGVDIEQLVCELHEVLEVTALQRSWQCVIARHPALRTNFRWQGLKEPQQEVHSVVELPWKEQDWRDLPPDEKEKRSATFLMADRRRGFDLTQSPLLRLTLFHWDDAHSRLIWTFHHALLDGRSFAPLLREVFTFYEAFKRGEEMKLPLPRPYRDYIDWLQQQDFSKAEPFWRQTLKDFSAPTPLVVDHVPSTGGDDGTRQGDQEIWLSTEITTTLRSLARENQLTLNTVVQGAWALLLNRYSGEADVVFGATRACRRSSVEGAEAMVGLFINTLPLRVRVNPEAPLLPWLKELRVQWMAMREYEHTPLVKIPGWSGVPAGSSLFESIVVFENFHLDTLLRTQGGSWSNRRFRLFEKTNYPITLAVYAEAELCLKIGFDRSRFDDATIGRMLGHLRTLLEAMAEQPQRRLGDYQLLTPAERHQMLVEWNATRADYPEDKCIHELFEAQVERTPEAVAVVFEDRRLTYAELNRRANQLAHRLRKMGVQPDTLVGICVERSLEMVVGILGILKAGGAYLPLDPAYPKERLAFMLDDARPKVVLTQQRLINSLPKNGAKSMALDSESETFITESPENPDSSVWLDHLAYVIYTSGSTGKPKGTLVTHKNVARLFQATQAWFHFGPEDVWTLFHSHAFDFSVWEMWGALCYGGRLVVVPYWVSRAPDDFYKLLNQERVTVLNQTPSAFRQLIQVEESAGRGKELALRLVIFGGEALEMQSLKPWFERHGDQHPQLVNMYGITETTVHVTYRPLTTADLKSGSVVGIPLPDLQVYILDQHRQLLPIGVPGEMYVGGAGVARGYLNRPELTSERFTDNPFSDEPGARLYRSGDLARYLPNRDIEYLGRIDHQVKIRGFRVELGEIESVLRGYEGVKDVAVLVREDVPGDKRLVAYLTAKAGEPPNVSELRGLLEARLPEYMVPSAFVTLDRFPLTPNGKLDRKALPMPDLARPELEKAFVAPRTPIERVLADIWGEVLGLKQIGVHDNFFELGGHSLLATQVISRVRHVSQVEVPLRALFDGPTIAKLAELVKAPGADISRLTPPVVPVSREQELPLSFAQERLWFLDQLEPNSAVYNIPMGLRLKGALNLSVLQRCLAEIVRRHETLRTRFKAIEGRPVQVIEPFASLEMPFIDLSNVPQDQREAEAGRLCTEEAQRPFDLTQGRVLRVKLFQLEPTDHLLLLNMHHIASDGWSVGLLLRELGNLYQAFSEEKPSPLPELPVQYADFAVWQREWLQGEVLEKQLTYWRKQLKGAPALLELPTDRPRLAVQSYRGTLETAVFPQSLLRAVKALNQREGVSLYMTLLSAFQTLMYRYSGQEDITVGSPIAGRNRVEIEGLIGFFVNTLVLRSDLSGNPTFRELLRRVQEVTLAAYAHQDLPFEKLVEELQPERNLSYSPLCQVAFGLQNTSAAPETLGGLSLSLEWVTSGTSKFDLSVFMAEETDGLGAVVEYSTDLFDRETILRLLNNFRSLLEGVVANPDQPIATLPLLTEAERHQMLVECNQTAVEYPRNLCVHELFEAQVEKTPDAIAVVFEEQHLTYRELNNRSNQLAQHLRALGVVPDVLVGVCVERSMEMVVGLFGVLKAGGAYVPIDPAYPAERVAFMLKDANAPVVLTQQSLARTLPTLPATKIVCLDGAVGATSVESTGNPARNVTGENLAYVIYTSGSTGQPKGAMIPHRAIVNHMRWMQETFPLDERDSVLQKTPFSFDASVWEFYAPLWVGGRLVVARPGGHLDTTYMVETIVKQGVTILQLVPSLLRMLLETPSFKTCRSLRRVFSGGEALTGDLVRRFCETLPAGLINLYGPTEVTIDSVFYSIPRDRLPGVVPIGRPVANTQAYVLDRHRQPVPIGVPGELYLGGAQVGHGYHNRPELTAERFIPDPFNDAEVARLYKTGDKVRHLPDGNIEYLGRMDHQVKIRGFRIELGEIETVLGQCPSVGGCVVVVREDVPGDKRLVAYLTAKAGEPPNVSELRSLLQTKLPEYMVPSAFVTLDRFPLTPNGKLDRKALPMPDLARPELEKAFVAPRTPIERVLADIWGEVLGLKQIGVHDNFFELGGHSLLATQVISRVRQAFEVDLPLRSLFESPTVEGMASSLLHLSTRRAELETRAELLLKVAELSESEVEAMLAQVQKRQ